jgi:hypothetical protein
MIAFSSDRKFIATTYKGQPNSDYSVDLEGAISIVEVRNNFVVTTLNFSIFSKQGSMIKANVFKILSLTNDLARDIEPEYIIIYTNSKTTWVTLHENSGVAKVDLVSKKIINIFLLGSKDSSLRENAIAASNPNASTDMQILNMADDP